jgi:hypothetical protein
VLDTVHSLLDDGEESLSDVLTKLRHEVGLRQLLDTALSPGRLDAYWHDNGFAKVVLATGKKTGRKLVLHVWPTAAVVDTEDNIHNHRWDFASAIIIGTLEMEIFTSDRADITLDHYSYSPVGGDGRYRFERQGRMSVGRGAYFQLSAGKDYHLNNSVLHRAWGGRLGATASVVVQSAPQRPVTTVLLRGDVPTAPSEQVNRLTEQKLMEIVDITTTPDAESAWRR